MSDNSLINNIGNVPVDAKTAEITISGDNNNFVAHAEKVENNI